ncbi:hypothetical protein CERSUDRAFT_115035 [Gelatoporia subvermispora B]|uniref:Wax synthase domain-containing protein n=1 Tax=Ceriporiopsis subvermispora (strain B) TaxID=914234 RepID=M2RE69_CERS8|nr:hypothetical protein CERSUDRAFT_115035 [Gelatoporia subvermispora B]
MESHTAGQFQLAIIPTLILSDVLAAYLFSTPLRVQTKLALFIAYSAMILQTLSLTTGSLVRDYGTGLSAMARLLSVTQLTWLTDATQFRRNSDGISLAHLPLLKRLYAGVCAMHTVRGVGWNCQVANIPPVRDEPRRTFVFTQLKHVARILFLLDLSRSYMYFNPIFSLTGEEARSISSQGYLLAIVNYITWGAFTYASMALPYHILAAGHVALGFSGSKDWPDLFGEWSDAYTVRRFWGRTWQQMMRRWITTFGKSTCAFLHLKPRSLASSYTQLLVGFLASGVMHTFGGNAMVGRQFAGMSFSYYLAQVVGIIFEDSIIAIAKRIGFSRRTRTSHLIGYIWVWAIWFPLTAPMCIDWALMAGLGTEEVLPFSLVRYGLGLLTETRLATWGLREILSARY